MKHIFLISLICFLSFKPLHAEGLDVISVGNFSSQTQQGYQINLPEEWLPLLFKKIKSHTQYTMVDDNGIAVIKAVSRASSSGLRRLVRVDPGKYQIIKWRWKIENIITKSDVAKKSGDDYPARIYITFEYDGSKPGFIEKAKFNAAKAIYGQYPPVAAINYIWDNKADKGLFIPNTYTDRVMMVVVESGTSKLNQWVSHTRNIYDDFKKAFGQEPPLISGVAIMTDTDNTGESATAFYGDIVFSKPDQE
ncbi:MAG: DUF3047 domain-containing protein [Desulfamplus sp.]|nr:DUF3047 domain-containing protein [Desulfamplus sp.]